MRPCNHLAHLPSGKCIGCGERHQPLPDYQPGDDAAYMAEDEPKGAPEPDRSKAPYGEMCSDPKLCAGKGYCPRDPTCGD